MASSFSLNWFLMSDQNDPMGILMVMMMSFFILTSRATFSVLLMVSRMKYPIVQITGGCGGRLPVSQLNRQTLGYVIVENENGFISLSMITKVVASLVD